ncbi:TRAP transporter large permease [Candidatus Atribacteria bacterium MT.SAG.1]|nr:TRAP transporter large permease [Candidatus Atribacteria bacterium MT.SAG.1]
MLIPLIIIFIILIFFRFPIALAIGLSCAGAIAFFSDIPIIIMVQRMVTGLDSFVLLAIPLFILTGNLMNAGGITDRLFSFARGLVGHFRGGLGQANIVASMIFSGMSGSAVADAGGLGAIEIKAMTDQGYPKDFSGAVTIASSVIGPVIPPSIPMVLYGALANVSVGRLFMGGIIPGILVGISLMILVYTMSIKRNYPRDKRISFKEFLIRFEKAFLPILTPVIILGGIISGIFTPTEAAAVAAVYAFALSFFVYRTIKIKDIPKILLDTMVTTAIVTFIISNASSLSYLLILGDISGKLVNALTAITTNRYVMLFILNIVLLFFGCVMEAGVALILLVPILVPLLNIVGIDLVHFGVVITLNLMIGVATPPIGMSLFVVSQISDMKVEDLMKSILPFLVPLIIVLFVITYIPILVTWIPNLVFGR